MRISLGSRADDFQGVVIAANWIRVKTRKHFGERAIVLTVKFSDGQFVTRKHLLDTAIGTAYWLVNE